ncbi:MAG: 2Fe-2S iron-sulfur cluster-binding protein [Chitinophagaceae bacterium]|jgi:xanthine dehydrogenase YagT iron-sulfur-binding subunit
MKRCYQGDSRRSFLVKSSAALAFYLTPSLLAKAVNVSTVIPQPIAKEKLKITINNKVLDLEIDPRTSLLNLLREQLGFTGTKKGCEMGQCGACIVHVDGKKTNSCISLALSNNNKSITTVEGLAKGEELHPMQKAFLKHDSFQCGYCTSGQIMSAIACVREGHTKSRNEIKDFMSGNICRCGAYQNIVDAITEVATSKQKI